MKSLIQPQDRLGLSAPEAAEFIGVGLTTFNTMVEQEQMPHPKVIGSRRVWDRREIEKAFTALPTDGLGSEAWTIA